MAVKSTLELGLDGLLGETIAVNRDLQFGAKGAETLDMIGVLVRDEDAMETFRGAADPGEALPDLTGAEPGVHQDAGLAGLDVGAIAAGASVSSAEASSGAFPSS